MLYKRHKIKSGKLDLIRVKLKNGEDVCDLCTYTEDCPIINLCTSIFTPSPPAPKNYDYAVQKKSNNQEI